MFELNIFSVHRLRNTIQFDVCLKLDDISFQITQSQREVVLFEFIYVQFDACFKMNDIEFILLVERHPILYIKHNIAVHIKRHSSSMINFNKLRENKNKEHQQTTNV